MYGSADPQGSLSRSEFDAARLGFLQLLRRKRMSPQFIERHAEDLFAQAAFEYSRQVAEGKEIDSPAGWIIVCGWHRTVGLLESRDWRPRMVSTEQSGEVVDEGRSAPEEAFLTQDRYRKVREAVEELPPHQRHVLALSYFEGESVREAAKRLNWTASKAQRAHEGARKRLHKLLGVESSNELSFVGVAAFLSLAGAGRASLSSLPAGIEAALDRGWQRAADLWQRGVDLARHPFGGAEPSVGVRELGRRLLGGGGGDAGAALAGDGGSRALEACKVLAVCLAGGGAITGGLLAADHPHGHPPPRAARVEAGSAASATIQSPADATSASASSTSTSSSAATRAPKHSTSSAQPLSGASDPAARRAQRRQSEEASLDKDVGAVPKLGAESRSSGASGSFSSRTAEKAASEPVQAPSSKEARETEQAGKQFQPLLH
jgi:RNA polymerase sigma factor (sigma-70 family)